jgi:hypothetical protein
MARPSKAKTTEDPVLEELQFLREFITQTVKDFAADRAALQSQLARIPATGSRRPGNAAKSSPSLWDCLIFGLPGRSPIA